MYIYTMYVFICIYMYMSVCICMEYYSVMEKNEILPFMTLWMGCRGYYAK